MDVVARAVPDIELRTDIASALGNSTRFAEIPQAAACLKTRREPAKIVSVRWQRAATTQLKVDNCRRATLGLRWLKNSGRRRGIMLGTMVGLARLAALGGTLALAGCVTTAENALSRNDIAGMKLTGVTVSFTPDAHIHWEEGIRAYATANAITDDQIATATNTPEGKAYVRNMLAPRIKSGVEKIMAGSSTVRGRCGSTSSSRALRFHRPCNVS
jgi:hypothetical protein